VRCPYLVGTVTPFMCEIYERRLGVIIAELPDARMVVCVKRATQNRLIKGCPYNSIIERRKNGTGDECKGGYSTS
jgi:hypothetical protein